MQPYTSLASRILGLIPQKDIRQHNGRVLGRVIWEDLIETWCGRLRIFARFSPIEESADSKGISNDPGMFLNPMHPPLLLEHRFKDCATECFRAILGCKTLSRIEVKSRDHFVRNY